MAKINNKWIIAIIVILIVLMMQGRKEMKKEATAGLEATRIFDSYTVAPGGTVTATYDNVAAGYMGVIGDPPTGWSSSPVSPSPDGKIRFTTDYGIDFVMTWTAPATPGDYVFTGEYFVSPDVDWTPFSTDTITVVSPSCTPSTEDSDCSTDNECRNYYCDVDTCAFANINEGSSCDAGTGTCELGVCVLIECTESWSCTDYSPITCPSSCERTRTCTDANACGTTVDKPAEIEACSGGDCGACTSNWSAWSTCSSSCTQTRADSAGCESQQTQSCTGGDCVTSPSDDCEIYQTLKDGECKTAGWVYAAIGFMAFMMFFKMM